MVNVGEWIDSHKQQAGAAGAGVAVLILALFHKSRAANAAATSAALTDTSGTAMPGGTIGVPGTTVADIQNAVQDQINDDVAALRAANAQQIAAIPRGATGPAGPAGKPVVPTMFSINRVRADQGQPLLTNAQYISMYPTAARYENYQESLNVQAHQKLYAQQHQAPRTPPPPAPKPKPPAPKPKPAPHLPAAPTAPKSTVKLIPPASKSVKK